MEAMRITVVGATGFIGRQLVGRLLKTGHWVKAVARHPEAGLAAGSPTPERLKAVTADILDHRAVSRALLHSDLVINLVGAVLLPNLRAYFDLHERGARNIAEAAYTSGTARLVHISALGITDDAPSAADRSKAAGETAVRSAFPAATLVRPSLVFGEHDHFLSQIDRMSRFSPVIPLLGAATRVQPVHVDDFVEGLARIVECPGCDGQTYAFAGPRVYTLRQVVELLLAARGRRRLVMPLPHGAAMAAARLLELLPKAPLNRELVELMRTDKIAPPGIAGLGSLGVTPRALDKWLAAQSNPRG